MKRSVLAVGITVLLSTPASAAPQCAGDCDGDGVVRIDEVVRLVKGMLGSSCLIEPWLCPPVDGCLDVNGDGQVEIPEISQVVEAVANMLDGCP